ncbi:MAG: MIP/aquaporin family protein [Lactococcus petauri]|uniref:MIP/aquaporin family protein n=1 Tax=Lactococcus petauri TaxID=1940789 RepID=UPI00255081E8|nr:MIP/aquaporin family protein [Lactococcus petauri]
MISEVLGELLGTAILLYLGGAVIAANVLRKTKSEGAGWLVIIFGWGLAVMFASLVVGFFSPAYLNPAIVFAMVVLEEISLISAFLFIIAEFLGAMFGAFLVWLHYYPHWEQTTDAEAIFSVFATAPAIKHSLSNFFAEAMGTALLVLAVLAVGQSELPSGVSTGFIAAIIMSLGLSLGSTTGFAVNPARDLGPRLVHTLLPLKHKGTSDWAYAWIPAIAPLVGAVLAALLFKQLIY